jgi:CheY-like chemotaxis protein
MAEAERALLELDRGKNEFLAMLAHELRNPLSGVRNASRLLADSTAPAMLAHAREIIERQTGNMVRMIDDLLDVSRITYGKIELRAETVDLAAVLERAVEATAAERKELDQSLTSSLPDTPMVLRGDPVRLDQVFTNLLANASKFTREKGRIWLTVEKDADGAMAVVHVRDNGVGIDPTILPRIFELFVQADRASERLRPGMGLGLALAKRLVDLHGGTIEAQSPGNGLGSEFVVRLPLVPAGDAGKPGSRKRAKAKSSAVAAARRVLIVDDDEDSGESLRLIITGAGHEVRHLGQGTGAVAEAAKFKPDIVLLDIGLPDMDGYSVAEALRADPRTKDVHIVAVTGFGRDSDRARSVQAGIDDHLVKPIDVDALMDRVAGVRDLGNGGKRR